MIRKKIFSAGFLFIAIYAFFYFPASAATSPDLNRDGIVNVQDLGILLANWCDPTCTTTKITAADLNGDSKVQVQDLGILLAKWGMTVTTPPPSPTPTPTATPTPTPAAGTGIPFGPYSLFNSDGTLRPNGAVFTMMKDFTTANTIIQQISTARTYKKKILFTPTGGAHYYYMSDANGGICEPAEEYANTCKFDMNRWKSFMDTYKTTAVRDAVNKAISDGIIIGASLIDEPYVHGAGEANTWGEDPATGKSPITKAMVDQMCAYAKTIFPTLAVGPVHQPWYFEPDKQYKVCDMIIAEFSWNTKLLSGLNAKGDAVKFRDETLAHVARDGMSVMFGLNILNGGIPSEIAGSCPFGAGTRSSLCRMYPDQLRNWGRLLGSAGCGLDMWRYDETYMANTDNQQAFRDIASTLGAAPKKSCRRPQ